MKKLYSEMSDHELRQEIATLKEKAQKAEQMGMVNEYAVYERKMMVAKAYMMDPSIYEEGDIYEFAAEHNGTFEISYIKGYFAWGYKNGNNELEAFPISMLGNKI